MPVVQIEDGMPVEPGRVHVIVPAPSHARLDGKRRPDRRAADAQGHGSTFVERSVTYELQGETKVDFRREGLRVGINFPLAAASMSSI